MKEQALRDATEDLKVVDRLIERGRTDEATALLLELAGVAGDIIGGSQEVCNLKDAFYAGFHVRYAMLNR